jgi:membrane protein
MRQCALRCQKALSAAFGLCAESVKSLWSDECFTRAAAISYYLMVSIFPLLLLLIGIAGFFLGPREAQAQVLEWLSRYFPTGTRVLFRENIEAVVEARNSISFFGFIGLVWSSTLMFDAIHKAVNAAWRSRGKAGYWIGKLKSLLLVSFIVLGATASVFLTTQITLANRLDVFQIVPHWMSRPFLLIQQAVSSPAALLPFILGILVFGLAYRLLPQAAVGIRDIWPAALAAAILWEISKRVFVWYMTVRADYTQVYGSIGAVLILMLWAYLSSLILAWGAELAAGIWRLRRNRSPASSSP